MSRNFTFRLIVSLIFSHNIDPTNIAFREGGGVKTVSIKFSSHCSE